METLMDAFKKPASSAQKAVRMLIEHYQVYFVAPSANHAETTTWLEAYINVPAWNHTIFFGCASSRNMALMIACSRPSDKENPGTPAGWQA